jgi:competence protein ComEC
MEIASVCPMVGNAQWIRRPGMWISLVFATGMISMRGVISVSTPISGVLIVLGAVAVAVLLAVVSARIYGNRLAWHDVALLLGFVLIGALRYYSVTQLIPANHVTMHPALFGEGTLRGYVERVEYVGEQTRFVLSLTEVEKERDSYRISGRVLVTVRLAPTAIDRSQWVEIKGTLRRPMKARNPRGFDYRAYLDERGLDATLSIRSPQDIRAMGPKRSPHWIEEWIEALRQKTRSAVEANLQGAHARLLLSLLLGEKGSISDELRQDFRRAGLSHMLVVSGLHVGILTLCVLNILFLLPIPRVVGRVLTLLFLVTYAVLTHLYPPVVRATIVACIVLGGAIIERDSDLYNSLGWAALLIMVFWPQSPFGLSFQLSFAATLSIVALHEPLVCLFPSAWRDPDRAYGRYIVRPLCVSLAAQLGTLPLIAIHFQQWAPVGILVNLWAAPLLAAALGLGIVAVCAFALVPMLGSIFNGVNYWVLSALIESVERSADWPGSAFVVPRPDGSLLLLYALLSMLIPHLRYHVIARKLCVFSMLFWLNVATWGNVTRDRLLEVFFLDVGQGDAAVVRMPNGMVMVVDGGQRGATFDYGSRVVLPFLYAHNIFHVDIVLVSHLHSDHIGGLVALLEQMSVGHYIDSGQRYDSWTASRLSELIEEKQISYHRVVAGDRLLGMGQVDGWVMHPFSSFVDSLGRSPHGVNNGSTVLKLSYGTTDVLFTGDIEKEADYAMLSWGDQLQAEVLKVAHHGSKTSSSGSLLNAISPQWAIVSVGEFNRFGHPAVDVIKRLEQIGARVLRTDRHGAVRMTSDGLKIAVETVLGGAVGKP